MTRTKTEQGIRNTCQKMVTDTLGIFFNRGPIEAVSTLQGEIERLRVMLMISNFDFNQDKYQEAIIPKNTEYAQLPWISKESGILSDDGQIVIPNDVVNVSNRRFIRTACNEYHQLKRDLQLKDDKITQLKAKLYEYVKDEPKERT